MNNNLKTPVRGERLSANWGSELVRTINADAPAGGRGVFSSQDPSGTTTSVKKPWPEVRKLPPFPIGPRWAFGLNVWIDGEDLKVTIHNIIIRTGQTSATKDQLATTLTSATFTGIVYLLVDWANYPEALPVTPFSLVLAAPTLTATQELIPLYEFENGRWKIDWIHGAHSGQGWMPENWVQEEE